MDKISRRTFLKGSAAAGSALVTQPWNLIFPEKAFAAEDDTKITTGYSYCDMCSQLPKCGIVAQIKDGKIISIESREGYPLNRLCPKGISALQNNYNPERLLYPMQRTTPKGSKEPGWERISWDEAYDKIVKSLNSIKKREGADKVLFATGVIKEPRAVLRRLAYTFGSPNYATESSTCAYSAHVSCQLLFGKGVKTFGNNPGDNTKVHMIWSKNPAWATPASYYGLKKAKDSGVKIIVVDPRVTPMVESYADIHLQLKPGTDDALALGIAHVMIRDDLYDKDFVEKWTYGFKEYSEYVKEFTPERVSEITGVPANLIEETARLWGSERPGSWQGSACATTHNRNASQTHRAVLSLIALAGNLDVPGGVTLKDEPVGFDDYGGTPEFTRLTDIYPTIEDKRADKDDFPVWAEMEEQLNHNKLPEWVASGKIKAMVALGINTMMWPQSQDYQKAFQDMEFCVASDYYYRPWTHDYMDMILPAATVFERMAPIAIFGRRIYLREPLVKPAGEAKSDWQYLLELGSRLGYKNEFFNGNEEEALKAVLSTLNFPVTIEDLRAHPEGYDVPMKDGPKFKKYELGLLRPDGKPGFNTPSGKVEFYSLILEKHGIDPLPTYMEKKTSEKYPLILSTGSRVPYYSHSKERNLPWLRQFMPEPTVQMSPKEAEARGIKEGDKVRIFNEYGEVEAIVKLTNILFPGMIDYHHGWPEANANNLIPRIWDPITGFPTFKQEICQVEKIQ